MGKCESIEPLETKDARGICTHSEVLHHSSPLVLTRKMKRLRASGIKEKAFPVVQSPKEGESLPQERQKVHLDSIPCGKKNPYIIKGRAVNPIMQPKALHGLKNRKEKHALYLGRSRKSGSRP